jgi:hypothetical protein
MMAFGWWRVVWLLLKEIYLWLGLSKKLKRLKNKLNSPEVSPLAMVVK